MFVFAVLVQAAAYKEGMSTSRGLGAFADHVGAPLPAPTQIFDAALRNGGADAAALEIGCGEGRASVELQLRHPSSRCFCLNYAAWKAGWGNGVGGGAQAAADAETLRGMASHYGIGVPPGARLPTVMYGDWHNLTALASASYALIFSQNALNEGKMHRPTDELAPLLSGVVRLLRPGGVALLHLFGCCPPDDVRVYSYGAMTTINDNASATTVLRKRGRRGRKVESLRRPFGTDRVRLLDLGVGEAPGSVGVGCVAAAFVGFNFTTSLLLRRTHAPTTRRGGCTRPGRLLAPLLLADSTGGPSSPRRGPTAARVTSFAYRASSAPSMPAPPPPPPSAFVCGTPGGQSCREALARQKASKRANQREGGGPEYRQAYLDAVYAWMHGTYL